MAADSPLALVLAILASLAALAGAVCWILFVLSVERHAPTLHGHGEHADLPAGTESACSRDLSRWELIARGGSVHG